MRWKAYKRAIALLDARAKSKPDKPAAPTVRPITKPAAGPTKVYETFP